MGYENIRDIIYNVEGTMDRLLVSGFNVVTESNVKALRECMESCEGVGLDFGAKCLGVLAMGYERKRHDMNYDARSLIKEYFLLDNYLISIKDRLDMEVIKRNLLCVKGKEKRE